MPVHVHVHVNVHVNVHIHSPPAPLSFITARPILLGQRRHRVYGTIACSMQIPGFVSD